MASRDSHSSWIKFPKAGHKDKLSPRSEAIITNLQESIAAIDSDYTDKLKQLQAARSKKLEAVKNRYITDLKREMLRLNHSGESEKAESLAEVIENVVSDLDKTIDNPPCGNNTVTTKSTLELTKEQKQLVDGLQFDKISLPTRKGLTYFSLHTKINNATGQGVIEGRIVADVKLLCVDGNGVIQIVEYSKSIDIASPGVQDITIGSSIKNETIRKQNSDSEVPKNAYIAYKVDGVVFHEILLNKFGPDKWWATEVKE